MSSFLSQIFASPLPLLLLVGMIAALAVQFNTNRLLFWCLLTVVIGVGVLSKVGPAVPPLLLQVLLWLGIAGVLFLLYDGNRRLFTCFFTAAIAAGIALYLVPHLPPLLIVIVLWALVAAGAALLFRSNRLLFNCVMAAIVVPPVLFVVVTKLPMVVLLALVCLGVAITLAAVFRHNRLLFQSLLSVLGCLILFFGVNALRDRLPQSAPERRVNISFLHDKATPKPTPTVAPKKIATPRPINTPIPLKPTAAPPQSKPKGAVKPPHPVKNAGGKVHAPNRPLHHDSARRQVTRKLTGPGSSNPNFVVPTTNENNNYDGPDILSPGTELSRRDIDTEKPGGSTTGTGPGTGPGDGPGDAVGDPRGNGASGKNNRGEAVYIRLKYSLGPWGAHQDGTKRMLKFLNDSNFKCESVNRALTPAELQDKYLTKGLAPTFLYIYADESLNFTSTELNTLRIYMRMGGFLFIDSRPNDDDTREAVRKQVNRIIPGAQLRAISNSDPINSAVFKLSSGAYGYNVEEKKNYGVVQDGKLVVFYSPGNLSAFYEAQEPDQGYARAQYQMAANVMVYAMDHGDTSGEKKRAGASANISEAVLAQLGLIDAPKAVSKPGKPKASVKIAPSPGHENEPEDVKIEDDP